MKTPDLKPCQNEALKSLEWHDSYFHTNQIGMRVNCSKYDRHAEVQLRVETIDPLVCEQAKRLLISKLCERCKEVGSCENA